MALVAERLPILFFPEQRPIPLCGMTSSTSLVQPCRHSCTAHTADCCGGMRIAPYASGKGTGGRSVTVGLGGTGSLSLMGCLPGLPSASFTAVGLGLRPELEFPAIWVYLSGVVGSSRHEWRLYVRGTNSRLARDTGPAARNRGRVEAGEAAVDGAEGLNETSEAADMDEHAYVQGYVVQWGDVWTVIPVLLLLVLGGVKLVKLLLMALK